MRVIFFAFCISLIKARIGVEVLRRAPAHVVLLVQDTLLVLPEPMACAHTPFAFGYTEFGTCQLHGRSSTSFSIAMYSANRLGSTSPSIFYCSFLSFNVCDNFDNSVDTIRHFIISGAKIHKIMHICNYSRRKNCTLVHFFASEAFFAFVSPSARRGVNHCQRLASIIFI